MYVYSVQCKQCSRHFVVRAAKPPKQYPDQGQSETETDSVIASCPQCTHVYNYSPEEQKTDFVPWGEPWYQGQTPSIFFLQLECEKEDCRFPVTVTAPREADAEIVNVKSAFRGGANVHDLFCPYGHPILRIGSGE